MPIIALITIQKTAPAPPEAIAAARAHARGECGGERLRLRYRAFAGFPALFAEYTAERRFHPCADVRYLEKSRPHAQQKPRARESDEQRDSPDRRIYRRNEQTKRVRGITSEK